MSTSVVDEIRGILDGKKAPPAPGASEQANPADEAMELLKTHRSLVTAAQRKLDGLSASLGEAFQRANRSPEAALEALGDKPRAALLALKEMIDASLAHVESVVRSGRARPGLTEARLNEVDAATSALTEGVDTSVSQNNYASQLAASSAEAERFIGSVKQLQIGDNVGVGRNSYQVVNTPTKRGAEWFVALSGPGAGTGDGYSLLVPETLSKTNPPSGEIKPTREAVLRHDETGSEADLMLADIHLEGVDMGQYGGYRSGQGWVNPGDVIKLTKQVFRVIGKSGNSALIQPEKIAKEVYGDYRPAMGRIESPGDFPGRGGKDFGDAVASAPQGMLKNAEGHASLVGTTILKYNPHTGSYSFPSGKFPGDYEMADTIQIVGHDASLPHIVGESMTVERFDMMLDEAEGGFTMEKLANVVEADEAMKVNGVLIDPETARAILMVQEALGEDNQERLSGMPVSTMASIAWRMINQGQQTEGDDFDLDEAKVFPPGAKVLVDGRDLAIVKQAFPKGSHALSGPHYKVNFVDGDKNVAVPMKRVGVERR